MENRKLFTFAAIAKKMIPESIYSTLRSFLNFRLYRKEIMLTQKYALQISEKPKKDRITIVFIIWAESMWNSLRSVYEMAKQDERFDAYILAQPHITDRMGKENQNPCFDFLSALYKNVIDARADDGWFDLASLNPDYVFYTYPYTQYYCEAYNPANVRKYAKVCLIQYGYNLLKNATFDTTYNAFFSKNVAIQFVSCNSAYRKLSRCYGMKKVINRGYPKITNLGFPRFDLVAKVRQDSCKPCVLWTPRWWVVSSGRSYNDGSKFLLFYKDFLRFATAHEDVAFIIRPHPLMFQNFLAKGIMTQSEIDEFREQCASLGNITIDENSDYQNSINKASIFLADISSLLVEFFVTGKPVIFCADGKNFLPEAKAMDSALSLYHAKNWSEVEMLLDKLLMGNDEMKECRISAIQDFLPQKSMTAADAILGYICADYYKNQ